MVPGDGVRGPFFFEMNPRLRPQGPFRQNMIIAAEFMARIIRKYGDKVLTKIEEKERQEGMQYDGR